MLISHSHRFIFIHTAKTGGMSIRQVLAPLCEEPARFRTPRPRPEVDGRANPLYVAWQSLLLHAPARAAARELPEAFDAYLTFAFVRNPWDWQVSMYHFILREPTSRTHEEVKALGSFEAYLRWIVEARAPYPKGIPKRQSDMLTGDDGRLLVDVVGRYERLAEDFAALGARLGIPGGLPRLNRSEHGAFRDYYTPTTRALVARHLEEDIDRFGYTFDGP